MRLISGDEKLNLSLLESTLQSQSSFLDKNPLA